MLTNETISKLQDMHLGVMAKQFKEQMDDPQFASMSFEDRFSILVDAEWTTRKSNHLKSLVKNAGYAIPSASVEDIEYLPERKLDKSQILRLASCAPERIALRPAVKSSTSSVFTPDWRRLWAMLMPNA